MRILQYLKKSRRKGLLYSDCAHQSYYFSDDDWAGSPIPPQDFCMFFGKKTYVRKSKKQNVMSRSSVKSEYRAMVNVTCEIVWVRDLLTKLDFAPKCPMRLYYDNQVVIHIAEIQYFTSAQNTLKWIVVWYVRR